MSPLQLRELPPSSGFGTPHIQAFHGARFFHQVLEQKTREALDRARELGGDDEALVRASAPDALERQALSEAVQVFAAMTIEGAVNLLGVMALGEDQYARELAGKKQRDKLRLLLELLDADKSAHGLTAISSAKRLADARNSFVHPRPVEGGPRFDEVGRRSDLGGAREAMRDMHDFFGALQQCAPRYTGFFVLF